MRSAFLLTALPALALVLAVTGPAAAQSESVTVNSWGSDGSGHTLIDPATGKPRSQPALLQPWQFEQIHLKPPKKRTPRISLPPSETPVVEAAPPPKPRRKVATRVAAPPVETPPPPVTAPVPRKPAPAAPQRTASAPKRRATGGFNDLASLASAPSLAPVQAAPVKAAPPPVTKPEPAKAVPPKAEPPKTENLRQTASIAPAKVQAGTRQDTILFAPNAVDPTNSAVATVHAMAASLATKLARDSGARVQLMAYAGQRGEKSSDTRRLSVKRAVVVRQILIDDGIPVERIDVFALGGADDNGPLDRVDVNVKN